MALFQLIEKLKKQLLILRLMLQVRVLKQKRTIPNLPKPLYIIVHHGGGPYSFDQVNNHHKTWKRPDGSTMEGLKSSKGYWCGYHRFYDYDGTVTIARADNEEGAHAVGYNKTAIGLGARGDTNLKSQSMLQEYSLGSDIAELQIKYNIPNKHVWGHRRVKNTTCPGKYLYQWLVENYPD